MKYIQSKKEAPGVKWEPVAGEVVISSDVNIKGRFIDRVLQLTDADMDPPKDYLKLERALGSVDGVRDVISEIISGRCTSETIVETHADDDQPFDQLSDQPRLF